MKLLQKFFRLKVRDMLLFTEACCFLYMAKAMLLVLPFKICIRTASSKSTNCIADKEALKPIKVAIRRANKLAFWKNVCLVQSFAASWMLQRRGIKSTLMIGVNHDPRKALVAHAWLMVHDFEIVPQGGDYLHLTEQLK
jgi:hypothetical protein